MADIVSDAILLIENIAWHIYLPPHNVKKSCRLMGSLCLLVKSLFDLWGPYVDLWFPYVDLSGLYCRSFKYSFANNSTAINIFKPLVETLLGKRPHMINIFCHFLNTKYHILKLREIGLYMYCKQISDFTLSNSI